MRWGESPPPRKVWSKFQVPESLPTGTPGTTWNDQLAGDGCDGLGHFDLLVLGDLSDFDYRKVTNIEVLMMIYGRFDGRDLMGLYPLVN